MKTNMKDILTCLCLWLYFFKKLSLLGTVSPSQGNIQAAARRTIAILAGCQSYIRSICYMRRDVAPTIAGKRQEQTLGGKGEAAKGSKGKTNLKKQIKEKGN